MDQRVATATARLLERRFQRTASHIAWAPGRVNLVGGHVDYNDGVVLPAAIDRGIYVAAAANQSNSIRVFSELLGADFQVNAQEKIERVPQALQNWQNYIRGVFSAFQQQGLDLPGFDAVICTTLPAGAGLGSSAAVEVAFATLLTELCQCSMSPVQLVELCRKSEHQFAGVPCGIMDQSAVVFGKTDHLLALDCQSNTHQHLPWPNNDATLLVIHSNVRHQLADGSYADRRQQCADVLSQLNVGSFRELKLESLPEFESQLQPLEAKRLKHVMTEFQRCQVAIDAIGRHDLATLGQQLFASHDSLRDNFEVSCPQLDYLVDCGRKLSDSAGGVWGMRMTGGGFGGSVIAIVEPKRTEAVARQITDQYQDRFEQITSWFTVRPCRGAECVRL